MSISLPGGPGASNLRNREDSKMSSNTKNRPDSKTEEKKKDNKLVVILIALLVIIIIALVVVVGILLSKKEKQAVSTNSSGREVVGSVRTVFDDESAASVAEEMRQDIEEGMFECRMSMKWTFENSSSESTDAYVANSVNNTYPIYFDVYIDDSDEPIYSSPVLPVGAELTNFKLDRELPAGEYRATVMYTLVRDIESQEKISKAGFVINIKVLN